MLLDFLERNQNQEDRYSKNINNSPYILVQIT